MTARVSVRYTKWSLWGAKAALHASSPSPSGIHFVPSAATAATCNTITLTGDLSAVSHDEPHETLRS